MENRFEKSIRNAITEEMESITMPEPDRVWAGIERTLDSKRKRQQRGKMFMKVAAVLLVALLAGMAIWTPRTANTFPFGSFFRVFIRRCPMKYGRFPQTVHSKERW